MSRSVKKGPFVQERLLARVQQMNEKNEKKVLKSWSRSSTIFPDMVGHTGVMEAAIKAVEAVTAANMCLSISLRIWSATSSANLHRPGPIAAMPAAKSPPRLDKGRRLTWQRVKKKKRLVEQKLVTDGRKPLYGMQESRREKRAQ